MKECAPFVLNYGEGNVAQRQPTLPGHGLRNYFASVMPMVISYDDLFGAPLGVTVDATMPYAGAVPGFSLASADDILSQDVAGAARIRARGSRVGRVADLV